MATTGYKKPPGGMEEVRGAVGIPPGKKASVLNMIRARPGGGMASAKKRRPKPGQEGNI